MDNIQLSVLQQEWATLQTQFDQYEKYSLLIKLFNVLVTCLFFFTLNVGIWTLYICAVIWLQDGIWKTFQHRIGERLEQVESGIKQHLKKDTKGDTTLEGMQFNLEWSHSRPGAIRLVTQYTRQALKPTVAYPHVMLLVMMLVQLYVF